MRMTAFDKQLLNIVQTGLPLTPAPFADIARQLGCEESAVLERLSFLQEQGLIRRLGAFFDAGSLGYKGWLVAAKVAPDALSRVALLLNSWPQVTHNDERDNEFNLWFTLQSRDEGELARLISELKGTAGVEEVFVLPTVGRYKVNLEFRMK